LGRGVLRFVKVEGGILLLTDGAAELCSAGQPGAAVPT